MQRRSDVVLGPFALADGQFVMRSPQLGDGPAWSQARLANRQWLERAFPAWGEDWEAEQSEVAWAQRWWRLRAASLRGRAMPFVLLLDGRLVGEIGVDAVDDLSGGGEASVWMVRDHGSSAVMNAASLLLILHCFTGPHPVDRVVSPVATTSRKGRSPGLSAVGMQIEATVPRKVGDKGMVDHDIWVVHNTAENRARIAGFVSELPPAEAAVPAATPPHPGMTRPALRAAVREARGLRDHLHEHLRAATGATATTAVGGQSVTLEPVTVTLAGGVDAWRRARAAQRAAPAGSVVYRIIADGRVVGTAWTTPDAGTATFEIVVSARPGTDPAVVRSVLELVLADAPAEARTAVRVPLEPTGVSPDDTMLSGLGLTHVATFPGNPEGPRRWAGEQRWEMIGS